MPAPADTLVVHLRIGDVIEAEDLIPPGELAARGRPRREIGRPRMRAMGYKACRHPAELRRRIFSAPEIIASARRCRVPRVELVGGSHNCERCPRSQAYIRELQSRLTRAGLTVELRLGGDPDEDFAHMVMAPHFMGHEHCGHYAETILRVRSVRQGKRRKGRRGTGRKRRPTRPGVRRRRLRTLA